MVEIVAQSFESKPEVQVRMGTREDKRIMIPENDEGKE
jgi:hypothetical protein